MILRAFLLLLTLAAPAAAQPLFPEVWPESPDIDGEAVTFPSHSPFTLADLGSERDAPTTGRGTLFLPPGASATAPVPAVIMLHGASGVRRERELTYGRQFAAMGVAALAVDVFGARRDQAVSFAANSFIERLMVVTETMFMADAYAALEYLADMPEIDGQRIALIGFSYGGMATVFAAYEQVAEQLAPEGRRFAAHVGFYGPCIARFADRRATGAPVLMLSGSQDALVDPERCAEIAADLEAGGTTVETVVLEGAYHQWDGGFASPRRIGRNLAECELEVEPDGTIRDRRTGLVMDGPFARRAILALCSDEEGYLIGADDAMRGRSNRLMGEFLEAVLSGS